MSGDQTDTRLGIRQIHVWGSDSYMSGDQTDTCLGTRQTSTHQTDTLLEEEHYMEDWQPTSPNATIFTYIQCSNDNPTHSQCSVCGYGMPCHYYTLYVNKVAFGLLCCQSSICSSSRLNYIYSSIIMVGLLKMLLT